MTPAGMAAIGVLRLALARSLRMTPSKIATTNPSSGRLSKLVGISPTCTSTTNSNPNIRLERIEKGQLNWRVEKMRLSKDKTTLVYNDFLTLKGIPAETYEYRLGNRSALEWVIDQYQVSTDKRSTGAPNNGVFCGCWGGGASSTIPTAPTIPNTSCASSARSSPSAGKR